MKRERERDRLLLKEMMQGCQADLFVLPTTRTLTRIVLYYYN